MEITFQPSAARQVHTVTVTPNPSLRSVQIDVFGVGLVFLPALEARELALAILKAAERFPITEASGG